MMRIKSTLPCVVAVLVFLTSVTTSLAQDKVIPNDPFFKYQISFGNNGGKIVINRVSTKKIPVEFDVSPGIHLNITKAWAISTGIRQTVVALLDDGFFYNHEDVKDNIWKNKGEIGPDESGFPKQTNGIDDDGNGYVDDVIGWDFAFDDPDPDCYIFDGKDMMKIQPYFHAISAMGIIGARGNNSIGVAGINWDVSMMLLKTAAQGDTGKYRAERTAKAIRYAADNGARVINWSGYVSVVDSEKLASLKEAIDYAESKDVLLVTGAGNSYKNIDLEENIFYPACYDNENILVVAEVDFNGKLYKVPEGSKYIGGSNFGVKNVDIAAIAQNFTTDFENNYSTYSIGGGTSCSAPVVTGVAALVLSVKPDLNYNQLKKILMESATPLPDLEGKIKSGGMVNAYEALKMAKDQ